MAELIIIMSCIGMCFASWAFWRAHQLHRHIERKYPGLNAAMQKRGSRS